MPFGEIPGNPEGTPYEDRVAARQAGVHLPLRSGIAGRSAEGAESIVVSGGYEDDADYGALVIYTGAGGRGPDGTQIADQEFEGPNQALFKNWIEGLPVRVVRGAGGEPAFSPTSGYRYDGLFGVARAWRVPGRSGFLVCRYERTVPGHTVDPAYLSYHRVRFGG